MIFRKFFFLGYCKKSTPTSNRGDEVLSTLLTDFTKAIASIKHVIHKLWIWGWHIVTETRHQHRLWPEITRDSRACRDTELHVQYWGQEASTQVQLSQRRLGGTSDSVPGPWHVLQWIPGYELSWQQSRQDAKFLFPAALSSWPLAFSCPWTLASKDKGWWSGWGE